MATGNQNRPQRRIAVGTDDPCCAPVYLQVPIEGVADEVTLLSALADSTRLQIVRMLAKYDEPLCVCEITPQFNLGQPTISHHLKVLRDARLVNWEKRGLWVYYSLNRDALAQATSYLNGVLSESKGEAISLVAR